MLLQLRCAPCGGNRGRWRHCHIGQANPIAIQPEQRISSESGWPGGFGMIVIPSLVRMRVLAYP